MFLYLNFLKLFLLVFVFKSCNLSQVFIILIKDFILLCYLFKIFYIRYLVHEERLCQLNSVKFTLEQLQLTFLKRLNIRHKSLISSYKIHLVLKHFLLYSLRLSQLHTNLFIFVLINSNTFSCTILQKSFFIFV